MSARFGLEADLPACILRVTSNGLWSLDDVRAYDLMFRGAVRSMVQEGCAEERVAVLIDARAQGAQSQEVVGAMAEMVEGVRHLSRKTAIVVSSALFARQVNRTDPTHRTFETEADALDWLAEI